MLALIVKLKGKIIQEVPLKTSREYIIGRGSDNQIVLPEKAGISRRHLSLSVDENQNWVVKSLSQSSELVVEGESTEEATISLGNSFQIRDFEFHLKKCDIKKPEVEKEKQEEAPVYSEAQEENDKSKEASSNVPALSSSETKIMSNSLENNLIIYLKISHEEGGNRDIFKLDGNEEEWVIGRDEGVADIVVDNRNISRAHFKILLKEGQYFIEDLKSSNGTVLNERELSPKKPYLIQSGDLIFILETEIIFELKNPVLEKELAKLSSLVPINIPEAQVPIEGGAHPPHPPHLPYPPNSPAGYYPPTAPLPINHSGVIVETAGGSNGFFKKNKKRIMIYGMVFGVVCLIGFFQKKGDKKEAKREQLQFQTGELAGLTPGQVQLVKVTYKAAQQLYSQGKFEYCKSEVKRVHELADSYQDSKKLEIACAQASENQRRKFDLEQKRKKAEKTEQFVQKITDGCAKIFKDFIEKTQLLDCLAPAMELVPADSRIQSLVEKFNFNELEKQASAEKIAKRKKFIGSIRSKYTYAKSLYKRGEVLKAMSVYQNFINLSNHAELKPTQATARRELATIKKNFNDTNNRLLSNCLNQFKSNQFKLSYYSCKKAVKKIPESHNKSAISYMKKAKRSLETQMKPFYEEANLNESIGNVSTAQDYWRKILEQDVSTGIYYNRAKEKMDKY